MHSNSCFARKRWLLLEFFGIPRTKYVSSNPLILHPRLFVVVSFSLVQAPACLASRQRVVRSTRPLPKTVQGPRSLQSFLRPGWVRFCGPRVGHVSKASSRPFLGIPAF